MTDNLYALLVSIDKYQDSVFPLKGCVNELTATAEYLKETEESYT
jgi:hypothetical protein